MAGSCFLKQSAHTLSQMDTVEFMKPAHKFAVIIPTIIANLTRQQKRDLNFILKTTKVYWFIVKSDLSGGVKMINDQNKLLNNMQDMSVEKIMSQSVVTVEMDDPIRMVKEIFDNTHFHHLLVVESNKLFGIISDRDLLKSLSPNIGTAAETDRDTATLNKKVHQIMTRKPVSLERKASLYDAIKVFNHHNISGIPVVTAENEPVGIISWRDILKALEPN